MTPLSKDDVDTAAEKFDYSDFSGEFRTSLDGLHAFAEHIATLARADIVAENERLKFALADTGALELGTAERLTATRTALAAAEADNERLQKALEEILTTDWVSDKVRRIAKSASTQPRDDSALREMIAGVYEECAKVPDNVPIRVGNAGIWGVDVKNSIRALAEKARHGS